MMSHIRKSTPNLLFKCGGFPSFCAAVLRSKEPTGDCKTMSVNLAAKIHLLKHKSTFFFFSFSFELQMHALALTSSPHYLSHIHIETSQATVGMDSVVCLVPWDKREAFSILQVSPLIGSSSTVLQSCLCFHLTASHELVRVLSSRCAWEGPSWCFEWEKMSGIPGRSSSCQVVSGNFISGPWALSFLS